MNPLLIERHKKKSETGYEFTVLNLLKTIFPLMSVFRIENIDFALDIVTTFKNYFIGKW